MENEVVIALVGKEAAKELLVIGWEPGGTIVFSPSTATGGKRGLTPRETVWLVAFVNEDKLEDRATKPSIFDDNCPVCC